MISFQQQLGRTGIREIAASGLLVAGVAAFLVGLLKEDHEPDPQREWVEIEIE